MALTPSSTIAAEEERIKEAYSRRAADQRYSWFSRGNLWMAQRRERDVLDALRRHGVSNLSQKRVLDVGCGHGQWLLDMIKWGARPENLFGVDLLAERIAGARFRLPQPVHLETASATALPARSASQDIVVLSTVFSSILDQETRGRVAAEVIRVLRPEKGLVLWYDFFRDNPRNKDVKGVTKRTIHALFPDCAIDLRRTTLAPPIARRIGPHSWLACDLLDAIGILRTHYVGVFRRHA
jgi:ubiquinone/menaquinone biosynthesis C-methylase UbiE